MRGVPDYNPARYTAHYDLLGVALRTYDRVVYCRCGEGGLTVAWVVQLVPDIVVFERDARRYVRILDSHQVVIVEDSAIEREVRKALHGIGLASSPQREIM